MEILLVTFSLNELCAVVVVATVTLSARLLTYGVDEFSILVQGLSTGEVTRYQNEIDHREVVCFCAGRCQAAARACLR